MPGRRARDYSKSVIYKLCCRDIQIKEIYIGSTLDFKRRKFDHKSHCNNPNSKRYNLNVYQFIRENGGWENFDMVQIEAYNASDKRVLHTRERHWIETLGAGLNRCIPTRSGAEWREANKQHIVEKNKQWYQANKEQKKQYYEANKQQIAERMNQKFNCECGGRYTTAYKSRHFKTQKHKLYLQNQD